MKVYNLTDRNVVYKGRTIPPNGGFAEMGDLSFIPSRDLALENARVLAFGRLPDWWEAAKIPKPTPDIPPVAVVVSLDTKSPEVTEKKILVTTDEPEKPKKK